MIIEIFLDGAGVQAFYSSRLEDKLTVAFCGLFIGHQVCLQNSFDLPFHHDKHQSS